jgi:hypothetical protein
MNDIVFNMTGYTKLFGSIVDSTIWRESKETKIVWITMLAKANKEGIVEASLPGLADASRVSIEECQDALKCLSSPDKYSRTKDFEGRRIEEVDGGWRVLNHAKYRAKMNADERREYFRLKKQEQRGKACPQMSNFVKDIPKKSTTSTQSEAYSEAKSKASIEAFDILESRLCKMFNRKIPVFPYKEQSELAAISRRAGVLGELKEIEDFETHGKFFPQSMMSLLSKWDETLDRARRKPERTPEEERRIKNLANQL